MEFWSLEFLFSLITCFLIYKLLSKNNDFFKKRGITYEKPTFLVGNFFKMLTWREGLLDIHQRLYNQFSNKSIYGLFLFIRPILVVTDPEMIKQIFIKNFDHFVNRDSGFSKNGEGIIAKSVLILRDDEWREMRRVLTPIFTSFNLKTLYHHLISCAQDLEEFLEETLKNNNKIIINSKDVFGRYVVETISSTALGFKGDCIKNKDSKVFKVALDIVEDLNSISIFKFFLLSFLPNLKIFRKSTRDFFKQHVTDEIARRETGGHQNYRDVIQLLIQAKNGQQKYDTQSSVERKEVRYINWEDDELIAAQVFVLFVGGVDMMSALAETLSWELAMNPEVQRELIVEVDTVFSSLDGKPISFEDLGKMKFMEMVINEALRKWPPASIRTRECNKDCIIRTSNGSLVHFKKGDSINVPGRMIQHDPKYYENPLRFDPRRFSDENKHKIVPATFLSFGYGPRNCNGQRLALLKIKLLFFTILSKYSIEICDETPKELTMNLTGRALNEKVFVELKPR